MNIQPEVIYQKQVYQLEKPASVKLSEGSFEEANESETEQVMQFQHVDVAHGHLLFETITCPAIEQD